jgi:hypothetical protein
MTVARFYRCERMTSERLVHAPTLGCVRIVLNMIHGPMDQNKVSQHRWQKRSLHQNNDCGSLRHDMDFRFDAYEGRPPGTFQKVFACLNPSPYVIGVANTSSCCSGIQM